MSKPRVIKVTFIEPYDDSDSDSDHVPSQTPESEDYSSLESSQYSNSSSQYSEAGSSDLTETDSSSSSLE